MSGGKKDVTKDKREKQINVVAKEMRKALMRKALMRKALPRNLSMIVHDKGIPKQKVWELKHDPSLQAYHSM